MIWFWKKKEKDTWVTKEELFHILHPDPCTSANQIADRKYRLLSDEEFFDLCGCMTRQYIKESYDCDNFAHDLLSRFSGTGYFVAVVQGFIEPGNKHRWNLYVNKKREVIHIEPQTLKRIYPAKYLVRDWIYTI